MYDDIPRKSAKQEFKEREEALKYRKKLRDIKKQELEFTLGEYKQLGSDVKAGAEKTGKAIKGFWNQRKCSNI